jgi:hypothetical protein
VTSLPDWLVERAALDEVPPASRDRIERADPRELADRVAALRDDSTAELARHPAGPALAQIHARVAELRERAERQGRRRRRWLSGLGLAMSAATVLLVVRGTARPPAGEPVSSEAPGEAANQAASQAANDATRVKGSARLIAFRHAGQQAEQLGPDAVVRAGDVIQLRYNAGGRGYGVIASVDGAGVVTLHYPLREDAPPEATAMAPEPTALPHAYALDDAPRFERFFFITSDDPLDVQQTLAALRALAHRDDSATARAELPAGLRQWSLRLRKADRTSSNHESP